MKQQFREDIDCMSEQMKFGMQTLDTKITGMIELLEKRVQYNMDGMQKTLYTKFSNFAN